MSRKKYVITDENDKTAAPVLLNLAINVFITFALSLSIYLLIANIFLIINKISVDSPFADMRYASSFLGDDLYNQQQQQQQQQNEYLQAAAAVAALPAYYDCSNSVLSLEECDIINRYHNDHLLSINKLLTSSSNSKSLTQLQHSDSLRVNTSLYIH